MAVTIAPDCFNADDPVDPDWESLDDDEYDARYPAEATGHTADGWEAEPNFRVATDSPERAADVLLVVAERFMRVGQSGREYGDSEELPWDEDPTPSLVRVSVDDEAAYVSANTDDSLSHEMADTMKYILIQELTTAGVAAVISADYHPSRGTLAEPWPRRRD